MSKLSKNILDKIKQGEIKPHSKWYFLLKSSFYWTFFGISVVLGALSFSVILFQIKNTEWDLYQRISGSFFGFLFLVMPYFWFLLMVLFIGLACLQFRHTKKGYRYKSFLIVILSLVLSILFGSALYGMGASEKVDTFLNKIPHFHRLNMGKYQMWNMADKGFLAGRVIEVKDKDSLLLVDFGREHWLVNIEEADWRVSVAPEKGLLLKIIGEKKEKGFFKALEVRPWIRRDLRPLNGLREKRDDFVKKVKEIKQGLRSR